MKVRPPNPGPAAASATAAAPDEQQAVLDAVGFINRLRPRLFLGAWVFCGLLVVAIVSAAVTRSRSARQARGFSELAMAQEPADLMRLAKDYSGTPCGEAAAFALGQRLLVAGQYAQAATRFSLFCSEYPKSRHLRRARLGEGYALEGDGKQAPAEKSFAAVGRDAVGSAEIDLAAEAFVCAGRCASAQGKLAEAKKWYQESVSTGSKGRDVTAALELLKTVDSALPPAAASTPASPAPAAPVPAGDTAPAAAPAAPATPAAPAGATPKP